MGINLQKGQRVDLTKGNASLSKIIVGLGWDTNKYSGNESFDLDASAFLLGDSGKVTKDGDFVYFNNLQHESLAVIHHGDNLTGEGDGDDEQIEVDLAKVPLNYSRIAFCVTIFDAASRRQNFGQVSNAFIRISNEASGQEMLRFDLGEDFSVETAVIFAELYRREGEWKFNAIGSGFKGEIGDVCVNYGVNV